MAHTSSPFPKGHIFYASSIPESIANATALKLEEVKAFHAHLYGAQDGLLSIVGDFDPAALKAQLARLFGDWKSQQSYVRIPRPFTAVEAKTTVVETPDKAMAFYGTGLAFSLKDTSPDFVPLMMADYMLGGGFLTGRVPKRLREHEGLSYGARTNISVPALDDHAVLSGFAIYAPQNVEKVEKGFSEELQKAVVGTFTDDELKLAKEGILKQREQMRAEDMALAHSFLEQLDVGRTMAFEQSIDDRLKTLTTAEISSALKKYVDPAKLSVVKVGDFKKIVTAK
jgi:zinc protease